MTNQQKRSSDPTDVHVGKRVRMRRLLVGMTQQQLGNKIGVTFQQVQKYEKGINRISASRLRQIADIVTVPEAFFFEGISAGSISQKSRNILPAYLDKFVTSQDGQALARAFMRIQDAKLRRCIVGLVSRL